MSFESLGLAPRLLRNCASAGYHTPSPIQQQAIPPALAGRDVLAAAQTGTGKTAAFLLPLLQHLNQGNSRRLPRALILTPTRELAAQIRDNAQVYGEGLGVRTVLIFGGVAQGPQEKALARGCDLIIATPGRLLDLCKQGHLKLGDIAHVVLDEADRMLDMGFIPDLRRIISYLPKTRQTLLFSATFSKEIRELAGGFLSDPVIIDVAPRNAPAERVTHQLIQVDQSAKRALLAWMISHNNWRQVLVFARTKHGADRLARQLEQDGLKAAALHGGKTQAARTKALAAFKDGGLRVLVATDIAARGIDIDQLPHVINHDLPMVAEDYVHRIGRTGRAGESGHAISLVTPDERKMLRDIERLLGKPIERIEATGFVPPPAPPRNLDAPRGGMPTGAQSRDPSQRAAPRHRPRNGGGGAGKPAGAGAAGRGNGGGAKKKAHRGRPGGRAASI